MTDGIAGQRTKRISMRKSGLSSPRRVAIATSSRLAIERNAAHGLQLTSEDKRTLAVKLYDGRNKDHLSKILAVPLRTMKRWLERKDSSLRQERERKIYEMWLACYTQEEIAEAVGLNPEDKSLRIIW